MPSSSNSRRARLGPRPGRRVISSRPGGYFARSFSAAGIVAGVEQRDELLLERLADPGQRVTVPCARHRRDRHRRLARRLRRRAVGEHAVHDRAVELVEVGELVEGGGDLEVRGVRGHGARRVRAADARTRLAHPSHVRRGREPRGDRRAPRWPCSSAPRRARTASSSSTTTRPTGPADRRPPRRRARRRRGPAPHDARGPRPRLPRRLRARARRAARALVLEMDADFSHDPDRPRAAARRAREDADLVLGSRYVAGGGVVGLGPRAPLRQPRRLVVRARSCSACDVRDLTGGFKCFRREVLEAIDLPTIRSRGYAFQVELTHRAVHAGFRVVELPIVFRDRQLGHVEDDAADRRRGGGARAAAALRPPSHIRPARAPLTRARRRARRCRGGARIRSRARPGHRAHARDARRLERRARGRSLGRWLAGSLAIARAAARSPSGSSRCVSTPDATPFTLPGLHTDPQPRPGRRTSSFRNALVLALHAMACVAGFIAGSSLPLEAERYSGAWRWIHDKAGPLAIAFVIAATAFSLLTQSYVLGDGDEHRSPTQLDISPGLLLVGLLPHALPELVALFLPLAAWIIASRQRRLAPAARRDVRHRPARRAGARRRGVRRGLRQPGSAALRSPGRARRARSSVASLCIVGAHPHDLKESDDMAGSIMRSPTATSRPRSSSPRPPILVDFWAPWCGPCRVVGPLLEEIAAERDDLRIVKLNVDDNQQTAAQYQVLSIPTMILFSNGAEAKKICGPTREEEPARAAARARARRLARQARAAAAGSRRSRSRPAPAPRRRGPRATAAPMSGSTFVQYSTIRGFISSVTSGSPAWPRMFVDEVVAVGPAT